MLSLTFITRKGSCARVCSSPSEFSVPLASLSSGVWGLCQPQALPILFLHGVKDLLVLPLLPAPG